MRYGCRAHDYGCHTAPDLARILQAAGYNAAQLAVPKAIRGGRDVTCFSPDELEALRAAFAARDIRIAVLSCYRDLSSPDPAVRAAAVADAAGTLACQKALGAGCVGSESSYGEVGEAERPAALERLTDTVLRIVEAAARQDGVFALEPVFVHALGTAEALQALKDRVADPQHFRVILDPVNVLTADRVADQQALWTQWTGVIGGDLAAVHVKDAQFFADAPRRPTALGRGQMDYSVLSAWLHREHPDVALLRDELEDPAWAENDLAFLHRL